MTETVNDEWRKSMHQQATEAVDRGWNIIPLSITSKKPIIKWAEYQTKQVTQDDVDGWFYDGVATESGTVVKNFNLALITGSISGIVVVDCDNDKAVEYCKSKDLTTPFSAKTTRGRHYYFAHPRNGTRFQNTVDLHKVQGLDFRGDGGYVVMPPSIKVKDGKIEHMYEWEIGVGCDWDNLDDFTWDEKPTEVLAPIEGDFSFGNLDLENVKVADIHDAMPIWDQAKLRVAHINRKFATGDGTDTWMFRFVAQKVRQGITGDDLYIVVNKFHDEFFDSTNYTLNDTDKWLNEKIKSAIDLDKRNYRSDYDSNGERKNKKENRSTRLGRLRPIHSADVDRLIDTLGDTDYIAEPLIAHGTISQVVGYNGHGKSFFLSALLTSLASGRPNFGPYETKKPCKVFYLDYDNPARTVLHRFKNFTNMFGDTGTNMNMWSPALISKEDGGEMNLRSEEGFRLLEEWLDEIKPDVVVIDTVRNAFGGIEEASASEWFKVNHVARSIRTKYNAAVVVVHHRNKPGESGLGREAGSTAQLTDIDTQIMVTQVFQNKQDAKQKAGILDGDFEVYTGNGEKKTPFGYLDMYLEPDSRLKMVTQITFGKVRSQTEMHQTHYIGWAERLANGSSYIVSTLSPKQKAIILHQSKGKSAMDISRELMLPVYEVKRWIGE